MTVTLHVCITCRAGQPVPEGEPVPGARLHDALAAEGAPDGVRIVPVECLSACANGAAYAQAPDGIVPWRERVTIFRKRSLARIPPIG